MESCLYEGRVRHQRFTPVEHAFELPLFLVYLDLSELEEVFRGRWLWSTRRPAFAWFRRADHLGDGRRPLDACVRELVEARLGRRPRGPVRLLTHLRTAGYAMNPVSFYYCFGEDGRTLEAVVAEVTNTPWGERHCYVLEAAGSESGVRARKRKELHVSPFMDMAQRYAFRLNAPGRRLSVSIANHDPGGATLFQASLALVRREIDGRSLASALVRYPFCTARVAAAIYWQALRLHRKGVPFHPHPRRRIGEALLEDPS